MSARSSARLLPAAKATPPPPLPRRQSPPPPRASAAAAAPACKPAATSVVPAAKQDNKDAAALAFSKVEAVESLMPVLENVVSVSTNPPAIAAEVVDPNLQHIKATGLLKALNVVHYAGKTALILDNTEQKVIDRFISYQGAVTIVEGKKCFLDVHQKRATTEEVLNELHNQVVASMRRTGQGLSIIVLSQQSICVICMIVEMIQFLSFE
jgi:hypothetical protein